MGKFNLRQSLIQTFGVSAFLLGALPVLAGTLSEEGGTGGLRLQSAQLPMETTMGITLYNRLVNMNTESATALNSLIPSHTVTQPNGQVADMTLWASDHVFAASVMTRRYVEAHVAVPVYAQDIYWNVGGQPDQQMKKKVLGDVRYGLKLAMPFGKGRSPMAVALLFGGSVPTTTMGALPAPRKLEYFSIDTNGAILGGSPHAGTGRDDWHIGGALTLDLQQSAMPLPMKFHINAGSRKTSALSPYDRDYFDVMSFGAGFEGGFSQYASLLGEYWHENRLDAGPGDKTKLDEFTVALGFHIPIGISVILGAGFAMDNLETSPVNFRDAGEISYLTFNQKTSPDAQVLLALTYTGVLEDLDSDKDKIKNKVDKCPLVPEDYDGFEDKDGCPEVDNDKDGILDPDDKCPLDPEDMDGFEDKDGCPDPDNDNDKVCDPWIEKRNELAKYAGTCQAVDKCPEVPQGLHGAEGCPFQDTDKDSIFDHLDKCPKDPEDRDMFEDEDGCPEPDNDKDGICDPWIAEKGETGKYAAVCRLTDKCPMQPENINAYQDDDGCPDVAPIQQKTLVLRGVNFETGKATLLAESYPVLDDVAAQLVAAPEVEIEVSGHTDNRSGYEFNMNLSRNRAQTVANHLISKGVAPTRLKVAGYGFTKPIGSNRTADGRLQNRRVEFNRIDKPKQ